MTDYPANRLPAFRPSHPGETIREDLLPALKMTVTAAAKKLGVSRQMLHLLLAEKAPVTTEMALRLGKFFGNGPDFWIGMQQLYDLWHAERKLKRAIAKIETQRAA